MAVFKNEQMDKAFMSGVRGNPYEMKDTSIGSWPRKAHALGCRMRDKVAALEKAVDNFAPPKPLAAPAMAAKPKTKAEKVVEDAIGEE